MILIAHRGNTDGKFESHENEPTYIDLAINKGYDVEVDVWYKDGMLWLGHDKPDYGVDFRWFRDRVTKLWVHCKNVEAVEFFKSSGYGINYFWHENDTLTITSNGNLWVFPGKQPVTGSIAVMPELYDDDTSKAAGICSDFVSKYKK